MLQRNCADWKQTKDKVTPGNNLTLLNRGYIVEARFRYALTDKFNMYVGIDHSFDQKIEDTTKKDSLKPRSYTMNGLSIPLVAANEWQLSGGVICNTAGDAKITTLLEQFCQSNLLVSSC